MNTQEREQEEATFRGEDAWGWWHVIRKGGAWWLRWDQGTDEHVMRGPYETRKDAIVASRPENHV